MPISVPKSQNVLTILEDFLVIASKDIQEMDSLVLVIYFTAVLFSFRVPSSGHF